MNDVTTLIRELKNTSARHDGLKVIFNGFLEKVRTTLSESEAYKIEEINFEVIDDNSFFISFINRKYKLVFSSAEDGRSSLKGQLDFYRVFPHQLIAAGNITFNNSGYVEEYRDTFDNDGLDLRESAHCVNLLLHWIYEEIKS